jgi:hypothetical protein
LSFWSVMAALPWRDCSLFVNASNPISGIPFCKDNCPFGQAWLPFPGVTALYL